MLSAFKWTKCSDQLPTEGRNVLVRHTRTTRHSEQDQEGTQFVVAKLIRGITQEEREVLRCSPSPAQQERARVYTSGDIFGNNLVPYSWSEFGPGTLFGQEVTEWAEIDRSGARGTGEAQAKLEVHMRVLGRLRDTRTDIIDAFLCGASTSSDAEITDFETEEELNAYREGREWALQITKACNQ